MNSSQQQKPRFIKPPNRLKAKVGVGGIDERRIVKAQDFMEKVEVDFAPIAKGFINEIKGELKSAKDKKTEPSLKIINAIMQLKANGGMFRYQLVSEIAEIALNFIEHVPYLDNDAIAVITAHMNTLEVITTSKLKGDGGQEGYALAQELNKACNRYFKKHSPKKQ